MPPLKKSNMRAGSVCWSRSATSEKKWQMLQWEFTPAFYSTGELLGLSLCASRRQQMGPAGTLHMHDCEYPHVVPDF